MSGKLAEFLIEISKNRDALSAFQNNPGAAADTAGLSSAEKAVLLSGDPSIIRNALAEDAGNVRGITLTFHITLQL